MSLYINDAAMDSWLELDREIDAPLRELMSQNGFDTDVVDAWISEMVQNSVDTDDGAAPVETQPKRIRRVA